MSYKLENQNLTQYFKDNWSTTTIAWPNVKFDPKELTEWVRFNIVHASSRQVAMGGSTNMYRHPGIVIVQVFTELNKGAGRIHTLADIVCNLFRGKQFSGLNFNAPSVVEIGINPEGWYQVNVACDYYRDESF